MPRVSTRQRLEDRTIRTLKPKRGEKYAQVFDTVTPGLVFRVTRNRAKSFYFVYRMPGKSPQWLRLADATALSLADARIKAVNLRALVANDKDPIAERRREEAARLEAERRAQAAKTFEDLARAFVEDLRTRKQPARSWRNYHRVLIGGPLPDAKRALKPRKNSPHVPLATLWAGLKLEEIRRAHVLEVVANIKKRGAFIHANRTFAYIRQTFSFALDRDWIEHNPCAGIHKRVRTKERKSTNWLKDDEIRRLWTALDDESQIVADVVRVLLLTAQRSGEVFRMRWDEMRDADGWWTLPDERKKNNTAHRVYLTKPVRDILERRHTADPKCEWVFRSPKRRSAPLGSIAKAIERLRVTTGLDFCPHDLRRTAATVMPRAGVHELTIPKILGHTPMDVTREHYNLYSYDKEKRQAMELWTREVDRILKAKDEKPVEGGKVVPFFARAASE